MVNHLATKKSYLLGVIISFLLISIGLNLYDNLYAKPVLQKRVDYMSAEAFESWLAEIESVSTILKRVRTDTEVNEALNYTFALKQFANILDWVIEISRPENFEDHLYGWIARASVMLDWALTDIAGEASTTPQNLDNSTLQRTGNLTIRIENLIKSVGTTTYGINPVQQLEEKGVLTQVVDYLKEIEEIATEIWTG